MKRSLLDQCPFSKRCYELLAVVVRSIRVTKHSTRDLIGMLLFNCRDDKGQQMRGKKLFMDIVLSTDRTKQLLY